MVGGVRAFKVWLRVPDFDNSGLGSQMGGQGGEAPLKLEHFALFRPPKMTFPSTDR